MYQPRHTRPRLLLSVEDYKSLRNRVLERDKWHCQDCGSSKDLQAHHLIKRSKLGPDSLDNLITLCSSCHPKRHHDAVTWDRHRTIQVHHWHGQSGTSKLVTSAKSGRRLHYRPSLARSFSDMRALAGAVLSGVCLVAASYAASEAEKAVGADAFVDSVGVNVRLHYTDTSYGNFAAVEKAIKDPKVRHIRDGLTDTSWLAYYDRLNALGRAGVKVILIASPNQNGALLTAYPARVADSFEGYEAPNEYDQIGGKDWAGTINGFMARLYQAVRGDPRTAKFPIVGPSLTQGESFSKVADTARFFDFANLHNYWGGRNPGTHGWGANGYGSYEWNLNLTRRLGGSRSSLRRRIL